MRCAHCGADLPADALFCGECGVRVGAKPAARSASVQAVSSPLAPPEPPPAVDPEPVVEPVAEPAPEPEPAPGPATARFILQFSTGESVTVTGTGLVGRNPVAEPGEYFDHAVTIGDPGKSVSKTHLEFGQEDGAFYVLDRFSGNGTVVRDPDAEPRFCEAGRRYRVARGGRVDIGDQFFIVS